MIEPIKKAGEELEHDGIRYEAHEVTINDDSLCKDCAFENNHHECAKLKKNCSYFTETDARFFVFKPVPRSNGEGSL